MAYTNEALNDQVKNLPGAENLNVAFNQFSGYLPVGTKNMHYWYVESQNNPSTDPIAFWTNGGPGCSGILGFLGEMGPFRPNKDLSLKMNDFSWNKVANMVFVEQPCGVGFSYSDNDDDYHHNDASAATDNYFMIQEFLKRFPERNVNDLYYTSESYGGHYMPTLAKEIVTRNEAGEYPKINYKGFAVGNPATNFYSTTPAMLDTYWGHQLVAKPVWDAFNANCRDKIIPNMTKCDYLITDIMLSVGRGINPYAVDYPVCTEDSGKRAFGRGQRTWLLNNLFHDKSPAFKKAIGLEPTEGYEPCEEDFMVAWINQASVKDALHVKSSITWGECSRDIRYEQSDGHDDMTPYYKFLIDGGYKLNILVYSGDDDAVCGTIGTQGWIWDLGYEVKGKMWKTYDFEGQTAGYFSEFKDTKLGFLTIHGAGHEVPTYKPEVALDMFTRYLKGEWTSA
jgi:carboxypeptidase C (cathepsin A)